MKSELKKKAERIFIKVAQYLITWKSPFGSCCVYFLFQKEIIGNILRPIKILPSLKPEDLTFTYYCCQYSFLWIEQT